MSNGFSGSIVDVSKRIHIVVPFYKNHQLVRPLFNSLLDCAEELHQLKTKVFFYNDSPFDEALCAELERCVRDNSGLDLTIVTNPANLGFVGTVNQAFAAAVEERRDVLLLNSDTCLFKGAVSELFQVAYSDPMIGFVSPRSNNATLCTLPHGSETLDISPPECLVRYQYVSRCLPKVSYTPTAVGFCLYIKWNILAELGGFDTQYGKGYNEENDLIMRANRLGYRAAMANHAFVWHKGEQSFNLSEKNRSVLEDKNSKRLCLRYPEYPVLVDEYLRSPEYQAEGLLGALCPDAQGRLTIGFDFTNFGIYHNGTFEAGKRLLFSAAKCWPETIHIVVFMGRQAWDFHGLGACPRVEWVDPHDFSYKVAAVVRMGQPFDADSIRRMVVRAPVVAVFMLDTIAADCGYLRTGFDQLLWYFTFKWSDVVFTNSKFTAEQILRRYLLGSNTVLYPSIHSVTPSEYVSSPYSVKSPAGDGAGASVLVIGNNFAHKALVSTVKYLAEALPALKIVTLGCSDLEYENVQCIESGALSDEELNALYAGVTAVVFPSHYEGFGFPVLHALARSKPIYVRKLPVFEEIVSYIQVGRENIRWFETTQDLVNMLAKGIPRWHGPAALGETDGWDRSATEVLQVLMLRIESARQEFVADRLRWFNASFPLPIGRVPTGLGKVELAARFISGKIDRFIVKIL